MARSACELKIFALASFSANAFCILFLLSSSSASEIKAS